MHILHLASRATNYQSRVTFKIKGEVLQCARINIETIWCFDGGESA